MKTPLVYAVVASLFLAAAAPLYASLDSRIESSAKKSYVFKTYLKDDSIQIDSKDGIVTLSGTVAEPAHKELAVDTVAGLPGVKSVNNQIEIKGENPPEHSDGWVALKVKTALLFHRNVSASDTTVSVHDGVVTLQGQANSQAQKDLTAEYAKDVEGVKDVNNELTVAGAPPTLTETITGKIDDASITAEVKVALFSHRSTSALNTKVETRHGVVTVTGRAHNAAEKDLVTKLITDINGVKRVVNDMIIDASLSQN